tara:strand:+ start:1033 stop:1311 length:279 start_codon:yes stop_codon:yes gene_type:complete
MKKKNLSRYALSQIPNTEEGQLLVALIRKYLNKDRYNIRVRGQGLVKGEDWRLHTRGAPLDKSTHLRVYIDDKLYKHKSSTSCGISAWRDAI